MNQKSLKFKIKKERKKCSLSPNLMMFQRTKKYQFTLGRAHHFRRKKVLFISFSYSILFSTIFLPIIFLLLPPKPCRPTGPVQNFRPPYRREVSATSRNSVPPESASTLFQLSVEISAFSELLPIHTGSTLNPLLLKLSEGQILIKLFYSNLMLSNQLTMWSLFWVFCIQC